MNREAQLLALADRWEARAAKATPTDAMIVRRHARELREAIATTPAQTGGGADPAAFKQYVHDRLDAMGVPHSLPESEHDKAGCRIGGRLDWIESRLQPYSPAARVVDDEMVVRALNASVPGTDQGTGDWNVASFIESNQPPFVNTSRHDVIRAALHAALRGEGE